MMIRRALVLAALTLTIGLPAGAAADPGDLLAAEPYTALLAPGVPLPGTAWKIRYESTSALGRPTVVTGSVLVPAGPANPQRPLVGYAIGSQGLADRCAPSAQLAAGTEYEGALIAQALQKDWTLALTDYPGLGTPGDHTYVVGKANGPAVLDAMRAARQLPDAGVSPSAPLGVFGYSEGGGATGAVVEQQPRYAPDLPLAGGVVSGVVADFERTDEYLEGGPVAFLLAYTAIGFNAAYPELGLDDVLNDRGRAYIAQMRDSCLEDVLLSAPFGHSTDFTTEDVVHRADWLRRFRQNNLGLIAPRVPVLLSHSRLDEVLPFDAAVKLNDDWCRLGANVEFRPQAVPEHILNGLAQSGPALDWLEARFGGVPTDGCNATPPVLLQIVRARATGPRRLIVQVRTTAPVSRVRVTVRSGRKVMGRSRSMSVTGLRRLRLRVRPAHGAAVSVRARGADAAGAAVHDQVRVRPK